MDERRTLDELDPPAWGPPNYDSYLVRRTHELRRKPLSDFTVEDLRIMIGQQTSLPHLVPRAIAILQSDALAEGDFYPGDLLRAVLKVEEHYWRANPEQWRALTAILRNLRSPPEELHEAILRFRSIIPKGMMTESNPGVTELAGGEVYLWLESRDAVHLKAASTDGDPVELTPDEARELASVLLKLANAAD